MAKARQDVELDDDVPRPKSDSYTGLLVLSLLAQIAGAVFLLLDYNQYPEKAPKKVVDRPPAVAPVANPNPDPGVGGEKKAAPDKPPGGGEGGAEKKM